MRRAFKSHSQDRGRENTASRTRASATPDEGRVRPAQPAGERANMTTTHNVTSSRVSPPPSPGAPIERRRRDVQMASRYRIKR